MITSLSLFSGGGGADLGMIAAGIRVVGAIEHDPDVAAIYRQNVGDHVTIADITRCDPIDFPKVDVVWPASRRSPIRTSCPRFGALSAASSVTRFPPCWLKS